jgi:hypothetical protein
MAPTRAAFLQKVFHDVDQHDAAIQEALKPSTGAAGKTTGTTPDLLQKAKLANSLANLTENAGLVRRIVDQPGMNNLRDVAFTFGSGPTEALAADGSKEQANDLPAFQTRLFHAAPTGVIHRQVEDQKVSRAR